MSTTVLANERGLPRLDRERIGVRHQCGHWQENHVEVPRAGISPAPGTARSVEPQTLAAGDLVELLVLGRPSIPLTVLAVDHASKTITTQRADGAVETATFFQLGGGRLRTPETLTAEQRAALGRNAWRARHRNRLAQQVCDQCAAAAHRALLAAPAATDEDPFAAFGI